MADRPIRVLFQYTLGLPYGQASEEERKQAAESALEMARKWKASGVTYVGYFGSLAGPGAPEFAHTTVLEVKDFVQVQEMSDELYHSEWGKYVEKYRLEVGSGWPDLDAFWRSA
ncbi:MAG: hypothetical protein HPY83_19105 [Anaerolineae bacterium]|nr:hypothetical protein [Anaerolineae bacterium]